MAFLRSPFSRDFPPVLRGRTVYLRIPAMDDHQAWADLRLASREFLTPWEPQWPANDLTRSAFKARIRHYHRDVADDMAYPFFIFSAEDHQLLGAVTVSNVRRGVAQMATLGYWIGAPFVRRGLMTEALAMVMPFAFGNLGLHRLEAACLPHNQASIALLRRSGFEQEGLARSYLMINGVWQDHLLFGRLR
ncbi:MAG: GNAT family N-acetyltransferase [Alphaproteobacteria bacterium]|nr:GNAT family N-acetyltransferase [Alphaproteobacteria bacterium]